MKSGFQRMYRNSLDTGKCEDCSIRESLRIQAMPVSREDGEGKSIIDLNRGVGEATLMWAVESHGDIQMVFEAGASVRRP